MLGNFQGKKYYKSSIGKKSVNQINRSYRTYLRITVSPTSDMSHFISMGFN